jgi:phosphatidate cytidylyltransferase
MLKERLITAAVLLPLVLGLMFFAPSALWSAVIGVAAAVAAVEWARLCKLGRRGQGIFAGVVVLSGAAAIIAYQSVDVRAKYFDVLRLMLCATVVFWVVAVPCWLHFRWHVDRRWILLPVGWLVLVPAWLAVVELQRAPVVLLLTLLVVWLADTAAYFAGRKFGRRKLAPEISPGKTVEGLIGGYLAVLLYALLIALIALRGAPFQERIALLIFALILATLSVAGDLFESWIKRQAGAKDSGALLPGHGGVLDRIDSLTATMPFAALYLSHSSR